MATTTTSKPTDVLAKAATEYAAAKAGQFVSNLGSRAAGTFTSHDQDNDDEDKEGFVGATMGKLAEGASPLKSAMAGVGASIKGLFSGKGGSKRPTNIVEDCFVGVPPDIAFAAWTEFENFASFMKGVENVARGDLIDEEDLEEGQDPHEGEEMNWSAKIFLSRRSWKSTTIDYDEPHRISWKTEGAKGTVDGTITFTAIGENATLILLVLEYRPKGPIEWIGNRWRAVGRRARLDLKHFRRYVMRNEVADLPEPEEQDDEQDVTDETERNVTDETPQQTPRPTPRRKSPDWQPA